MLPDLARARGLMPAIALVLSGAVLAVGVGPATAAASPSHAAVASPSRATAVPIVVTFGREGGNVRPLTVTIDANGAVVTSYPVVGAPRHVRLSADALAGLLTLARAEGFFALPTRIVGRGLPDIGGRFITIHTASRTKTVHVRYVRNAAFDQLYAVLTAVAGLPE